MAADILLYDASIVPVGKDQKQHIEITRDLGDRFNKRYGHTFNLPKYYIPEIGGKIMNLQNPSEKMSKSAPPSSNQIYFDEVNKPGISNLISIFSAITDKSIKEIENKYKNYNYGDFKNELANEIEKLIIPIVTKKPYYKIWPFDYFFILRTFLLTCSFSFTITLVISTYIFLLFISTEEILTKTEVANFILYPVSLIIIDFFIGLVL